MAARNVQEYLESVEEDLRPVAKEVRRIIREELPDSEEAIKWSQPTYRVAGEHVAYIAATKSYVTFGLTHGREIDDPAGRLEGNGKHMAHVKLGSLEDVDENQFRAWLRQAAQLARG